jgi:hypothetical protein
MIVAESYNTLAFTHAKMRLLQRRNRAFCEGFTSLHCLRWEEAERATNAETPRG